MINNDVTGFPIYFLPVLRASLEVTRTTEVMRDSGCVDTVGIDWAERPGDMARAAIYVPVPANEREGAGVIESCR